MDAFYGKKQGAVRHRHDAGRAPHRGGDRPERRRQVDGAARGVRLGPQREGTIRLDGRDISRAAPPENIAAGIAFVPQGARVFRDLTVFENLRMGGYTLGPESSPGGSRVRSRPSRSCASAGHRMPARSRAVNGRCSPSAWR
jgi:hypothetical protein